MYADGSIERFFFKMETLITQFEWINTKHARTNNGRCVFDATKLWITGENENIISDYGHSG